MEAIIYICERYIVMAIFCFGKNALRCPKCGGFTDRRNFKEGTRPKCGKCGCEYVTEAEYCPCSAYKKTVECPYCHSTNTEKISEFGRALSIGIFGISSGKIGKQWHCNQCDSDF